MHGNVGRRADEGVNANGVVQMDYEEMDRWIDGRNDRRMDGDAD